MSLMKWTNMPKLYLADLSKTCPLVASADTDLSVSACLRHVLDKICYIDYWAIGPIRIVRLCNH